ncbi:helix-turn-helix transcriptional regulator [Nonomuraea endophytica]|uniref:helix-turn-helix transcriptional regulator n=1 Tax=Nonomuraea endophytica TaxID=714136 RepID=UPI0037C7BC11
MAHRTTARTGSRQWLTVDEVCTELKITRRSWNRWRSQGKTPRAKRLAGNGPIRVRRDWLDEWIEAQEEA